MAAGVRRNRRPWDSRAAFGRERPNVDFCGLETNPSRSFAMTGHADHDRSPRWSVRKTSSSRLRRESPAQKRWGERDHTCQKWLLATLSRAIAGSGQPGTWLLRAPPRCFARRRATEALYFVTPCVEGEALPKAVVRWRYRPEAPNRREQERTFNVHCLRTQDDRPPPRQGVGTTVYETPFAPYAGLNHVLPFT